MKRIITILGSVMLAVSLAVLPVWAENRPRPLSSGPFRVDSSNYNNLADAVNAAKNTSNPVVLTESASGTFNLAQGDTVEIQLKGFTLTLTGTIENSGTLTVTGGNGTDALAGGSVALPLIKNNKGGVLKVTGTSMSGTASGTETVILQNRGTATIENSSYTVALSGGVSACNDILNKGTDASNRASLTITGTTGSSTGYGIVNEAYSDLILKNNTISYSGIFSLLTNRGKADIAGGTYSMSTASPLINMEGSDTDSEIVLNITAGNFVIPGADNTLTTSGDNAGKVKMSVSGGTFSRAVYKNDLAADYIQVYEKGRFTVYPKNHEKAVWTIATNRLPGLNKGRTDIYTPNFAEMSSLLNLIGTNTDGFSVELRKNTVEDMVIDYRLSCPLTIKLGSYNLTSSASHTLEVKNKVKDVTIEGGRLYGGVRGKNVLYDYSSDGNKLILKGVGMDSTNTQLADVIKLENGAKVQILNENTAKSIRHTAGTDKDNAVIHVGSGCTMDIINTSGSEMLITDAGYAIKVDVGGTVNMTGFFMMGGSKTAEIYNMGSFTYNASNDTDKMVIANTRYAIYNDAYDEGIPVRLTINGNLEIADTVEYGVIAFLPVYADFRGDISNGRYFAKQDIGLVEGSNIDINLKISGGVFKKHLISGWCREGYMPTKTAEGYSVIKEEKAFFCWNGRNKGWDESRNLYFETLQEAVDYSSSGDTVTLKKSTDENIKIAPDFVLKIDKGGFDYTGKITTDAGYKVVMSEDGGVITAKSVKDTPAPQPPKEEKPAYDWYVHLAGITNLGGKGKYTVDAPGENMVPHYIWQAFYGKDITVTINSQGEKFVFNGKDLEKSGFDADNNHLLTDLTGYIGRTYDSVPAPKPTPHPHSQPLAYTDSYPQPLTLTYPCTPKRQ